MADFEALCEFCDVHTRDYFLEKIQWLKDDNRLLYTSDPDEVPEPLDPYVIEAKPFGGTLQFLKDGEVIKEIKWGRSSDGE
jgi:hypothetical protein